MLRVNEIYKSFQGEGPNTGAPTIFVRFVGCNFKCPGWPCDSQHAIDPKLYRKDMMLLDVEAMIDHLQAKWDGETFCFTGGEVFLQKSEDLESMLSGLKHHTGAKFEVFTNGSLPFVRADLFDTIVLDWKLLGSGETYASDAFWKNIRSLKSTDAIKFTVKDREDYEIAKGHWDYFQSTWTPGLRPPQVYCGPVWGCVPAEQLAQWMIDDQLGWNLNVQTHKFVFDPDRRGI